MKIILFILIFSFSSFATLDFEDASYPELIRSARAQAMGNAFTSKVDDGMSAFYNPAGLGSVRHLLIHLFNAHVEMNKGFMNASGSVGSYFSNYKEALSSSGIRDILAKEPGMSMGRLQMFPNLTYRYITIGYLYHQQQWARLRSLSSDFELSERRDTGPVLAFNTALFGGILKIGATATYLTRLELQKDFGPSDPTIVNKDTDYTEGSMLHTVLGAKLTLPSFGLPTFSYVMRNALNANWSSIEKAGAPGAIPTTSDVAFSWTPMASRTSRFHFELGLRDVTNQYKDVDSSRKFNAGMELSLNRKFFFRLGYSDGWGSGGIGIRVRRFQYDLSTYGVEAGDDYRDEEDRRFVLAISTGL